VGSEMCIRDRIIKGADAGALFNNAGQHFNHSFYWTSMKPRGGGDPGGRLADAIKKAFGDTAAFKKKFSDAATAHFHARRRQSGRPRHQATANLRRLGARLLHRLPQRMRQVHQRLVEAGQLGLRRGQAELDCRL